jgi:hypothetical protein
MSFIYPLHDSQGKAVLGAVWDIKQGRPLPHPPHTFGSSALWSAGLLQGTKIRQKGISGHF